jgi:ABC-type uncharacterized transport system substrate-binding protein
MKHKLLLFLFFLCSAHTVQAHPHVWVDYFVEVRFDQTGLVGFQHRWLFDEMFSSQVMEMFDADNNGFFSSEEVENVRQGAFANLEEYGYFIMIKVDGQDVAVQEVRDFLARIDGHQVIYEFFTPLSVPAGAQPKTIHLLVADMEYFVDMAFVSGGLSFQDGEHLEVDAVFGPGPAFSFWDGAWQPKHFTLRFHES